jgi:quercetin dioxygenase-like cupin family protein
MPVNAPDAPTVHPEPMSEHPILPTGETRVVSLAEETRYAPNGIVSRTVFRFDRQRVVLFGFSEGQELTEHTSTSHALVQILSGRSEWTLDGEARTLNAGDLLHMPPNLPHAVKAIEPFSMLLTLLPENPPLAPPSTIQRPIRT